MRKVWSTAVALSITMFCFWMDLSAQESWDLEKCIRYAQENSLTIQQTQYGVEGAEINLKQAQHSRYPNLNFNGNLGWNFGRTIDPTSNSFITQTFFSNGFGLSSSVLLYNGGRINHSIKQNKLERDASLKDVEQVRNDIALSVGTAYLNALFAEENLENARVQLALSEQQLEQVDKLIEAGARPRNERLDLLAQVSANDQQVVSAENNLATNLIALKQLMNLEPDFQLTLVRPREDILLDTDPDLVSFADVYREAIKYQPFVESNALREQSAELGIRIAKSSYYPTLSLGGNLNTNYSNQGLRIDGFETERVNSSVFIDNQEVTFGVDQTIPITSKNPYLDQLDENISYGFGASLNIPLYNNYNTKASVQRARLNVLNTRNQSDQLEQNLKTNVQQALANARTAKRQLAASNRTLEAQEAAFRNAEKRFDLGAISTYDFINAKNQYDQARINRIIAKYDYLFKMKVLDYYMGRPIKLD